MLKFHAPSGRVVSAFACILVSLLGVLQPAYARSFRGEGSDLLMGVGAVNKGLGGAVVASTDDLYSTYWNPAGLTHLQENQWALSKNLGGQLIPVDFLGVAFSNDWLARWGLRNTLAFAHYYRLFIESEGIFRKDEFESIFIRLTLPALPEDFDGRVSSKTKEYRLAWGVAPEANGPWRLGLALGYVNCQTFGCGVRASDPDGTIIQSTKATTIATQIGWQYDLNEQWTLGATLRDPSTKLDVNVETTDKNGTEVIKTKVSFPREIVVGAAWNFRPNWRSHSSLQWFYGRYSENKVDFLILRQGWSYQQGSREWVFGMIVPLAMKSDLAGELEAPFPFAPTVGLKQPWRQFEFSWALHADLAMSNHEERPVPAVDMSVQYAF